MATKSFNDRVTAALIILITKGLAAQLGPRDRSHRAESELTFY